MRVLPLLNQKSCYSWSTRILLERNVIFNITSLPASSSPAFANRHVILILRTLKRESCLSGTLSLWEHPRWCSTSNLCYSTPPPAGHHGKLHVLHTGSLGAVTKMQWVSKWAVASEQQRREMTRVEAYLVGIRIRNVAYLYHMFSIVYNHLKLWTVISFLP